MKKLLALLTITLLLIAQPSFAIDLQTAKAKGLVGETPSGYLEAVKSPSDEVKSLVKSVNEKRKQAYKEIAARNKTSLKAVEELAAKKAIDKSKAGSYIKVGGAWKQK